MSWSHPAEAPWILGFWEKLSVGRGSCLRHQSACLASMGTRVWVPELTFLYKPGMVYILVILAEVVAPWDSLPVNLAYLENSVLMRDFASYKGRQHLREDTWGCWSPYTHADICKWSPIYICVPPPHMNGVRYHFFLFELEHLDCLSCSNSSFA